MLDLRRIRQNPQELIDALKKRGKDISLDSFLAADEKRRALMTESEGLKNRRNAASKEIAGIKRNGGDAQPLMDEMKQVGVKIAELDEEIKAIDEEMNAFLMTVPNFPDETVPLGKDDKDNVEQRRWGTPREFGWEPKAHWDIGTDLGGGVPIQNAQIGTDVPMSLGFPAKLAGLAPAALLHVVLVICANRHAGMGEVGHVHEEVVHGFLQLGDLCVGGSDLIAKKAHFFHDGSSFGFISTALFRHTDFLAGGIAQSFLFLHFGHQLTALFILSEKLVQRNVLVAGFQSVDQFLRILTDSFDVKHGS